MTSRFRTNVRAAILAQAPLWDSHERTACTHRMNKRSDRPSTAFVEDALLAEGPLSAVALAVKAHLSESPDASVVIFDDDTGHVIDLNLQGSDSQIIGRLDQVADGATTDKKPAGRGRPNLGVIAREVTLLPRHWEWLAQQRGGASATLRRLIDAARKHDAPGEETSSARETTYRAMRVLAGNREGFEEAARALFAGDAESFDARLGSWPSPIGQYLRRIAKPAFGGSDK